MKNMKKLLPVACMLVLLALLPSLLLAQPPDPCPDPADPDCPIDSGVVLLVAGAVAIAAKKAYDHKQNAKTAIY